MAPTHELVLLPVPAHGHNCDHHHDHPEGLADVGRHGHAHEHTPAITERWKWLTVAGNAVIGAAELATGNVSTLSVAADGIHNAGDAATYYMQAETALKPDMPEAKRNRWRMAAHWIIAASSLAVSAKAGVDLAVDHEATLNPFASYAAGVSLLLNGLLLGRLYRGIQRAKKTDGRSHMNEAERDLVKHFLAIDVPSAGMAVLGVATQGLSTAVEQALALTSGLVGAYAFRPTEANLSHSHSLEHHEHGHAEQKSWLGRVIQRYQHKPAHKAPQEKYQPRHETPTSLQKAKAVGRLALSNITLTRYVQPDGQIAMPPRHSWTYHYTNYQRDVLRKIRVNGERPGLQSSARAFGQLMLWACFQWNVKNPFVARTN